MIQAVEKQYNTCINFLVLATSIEKEGVFNACCAGIKQHSDNFYYIDILNTYKSLGKKETEKFITNFIVDNNINYLFIPFDTRDYTLDVHFIHTLSESVFIVMSFTDSAYEFEIRDRYYAQAADVVLAVDGYALKYKFEELGIKTLCTYTWYNREHYKKKADVVKDIDISFIGIHAGESRKKYIDFLEKEGISVTTYGQGTKNGSIDFNKMIDVFNRSKINLNFSGTIYGRHPYKINYNIRQCKGRPSEVALCGGFVLSEYAYGIEDMYDVGKEIEIFSNENELLQKVKYYLQNEMGREKIAENAYTRAVKDYDAVNVFGRVIELCKKEIENKRKKTLYLDTEFIKNHAAYRVYYICYFISKNEFKKAMEEFRIILKTKKISIPLTIRFLKNGLMKNKIIHSVWEFFKRSTALS